MSFDELSLSANRLRRLVAGRFATNCKGHSTENQQQNHNNQLVDILRHLTGGNTCDWLLLLDCCSALLFRLDFPNTFACVVGRSLRSLARVLRKTPTTHSLRKIARWAFLTYLYAAQIPRITSRRELVVFTLPVPHHHRLPSYPSGIYWIQPQSSDRESELESGHAENLRSDHPGCPSSQSSANQSEESSPRRVVSSRGLFQRPTRRLSHPCSSHPHSVRFSERFARVLRSAAAAFC